MVEQTEESSLDDLTLICEAVADADAFAALYRQYVTRVYRYHMAHTGNVKDAEDLISQTFMSALEGIKSYRGDGSFAAWILGIASKKRLMHFRGRRPKVPLEAAVHIPSPSLPAGKAAYQRLRLEAIARALKKIPPDRAEAVILSYFGGLSNDEIRLILRKSEAANTMSSCRRSKRNTCSPNSTPTFREAKNKGRCHHDGGLCLTV